MSNKLDELWELWKERESAIAARDDEVNMVIPKEIQEEIDEVMDSYAQDIAKIDAAIAEAEYEVRGLVVSMGKTLDSDHLMALYNHGKTSWDTKGLDGFAVAHSEINVFKKVGEPYVTIKEKKQ